MGAMQMTIYDYVAIGVLIVSVLWVARRYAAAVGESIVRRLWGATSVKDKPTSTSDAQSMTPQGASSDSALVD